jgi:hypothetical protein
METLPFFLAPQIHALAAHALPPNTSNTSYRHSSTPQALPFKRKRRYRRGQGKDPAVLEYALELPPSSLVHVALPFRSRCVACRVSRLVVVSKSRAMRLLVYPNQLTHPSTHPLAHQLIN